MFLCTLQAGWERNYILQHWGPLSFYAANSSREEWIEHSENAANGLAYLLPYLHMWRRKKFSPTSCFSTLDSGFAMQLYQYGVTIWRSSILCDSKWFDSATRYGVSNAYFHCLISVLPNSNEFELRHLYLFCQSILHNFTLCRRWVILFSLCRLFR